jgi:hypothetical protein
VGDGRWVLGDGYIGKMVADWFGTYRPNHSIMRSTPRALSLFLCEWSQLLDHGNPRYTDTISLALRDKDFGENEAILL